MCRKPIGGRSAGCSPDAITCQIAIATPLREPEVARGGPVTATSSGTKPPPASRNANFDSAAEALEFDGVDAWCLIHDLHGLAAGAGWAPASPVRPRSRRRSAAVEAQSRAFLDDHRGAVDRRHRPGCAFPLLFRANAEPPPTAAASPVRPAGAGGWSMRRAGALRRPPGSPSRPRRSCRRSCRPSHRSPRRPASTIVMLRWAMLLLPCTGAEAPPTGAGPSCGEASSEQAWMPFDRQAVDHHRLRRDERLRPSELDDLVGAGSRLSTRASRSDRCRARVGSGCGAPTLVDGSKSSGIERTRAPPNG